jgi:hypothetical protein
METMSLNKTYLQELSALFVEDVRRSAYYAKLSEKEREEFEARIREESSHGLYPLLPGANEVELERLSAAFREELGTILPIAVVEVLSRIDGFVENGVSLYGVDPGFREDHFDSGPGILSENLAYWGGYLEAAQRYLFLGDSDLWFFVFDLKNQAPLLLDRIRLRPKHRFDTVEEMVNEMMRQALGHPGADESRGAKNTENPPGGLFSRD